MLLLGAARRAVDADVVRDKDLVDWARHWCDSVRHFQSTVCARSAMTGKIDKDRVVFENARVIREGSDSRDDVFSGGILVS